MAWELRLLSVALVYGVARAVYDWYVVRHPVLRQAGEVSERDTSRMTTLEREEHDAEMHRAGCKLAALSLIGTAFSVMVYASVWSLVLAERPQGRWLADLAEPAPIAGIALALFTLGVGSLLMPRDVGPRGPTPAWKIALWVALPLVFAFAPRGFLLYHLAAMLVVWLLRIVRERLAKRTEA